MAKASVSSKKVVALIPIVLAQPEQKRLDDTKKYAKKATKYKNAKPTNAANSLYKQQLKQSLNFFLPKQITKWVVDGSISAMRAASSGETAD